MEKIKDQINSLLLEIQKDVSSIECTFKKLDISTLAQAIDIISELPQKNALYHFHFGKELSKDDLQEINNKFAEVKFTDPTNRKGIKVKKFPKFKEVHTRTNSLYIGISSSQQSKTRINQHIIESADSTSSLKLFEWWYLHPLSKKFPLYLDLYVMPENSDPLLVQILEKVFHRNYQPLIGD